MRPSVLALALLAVPAAAQPLTVVAATPANNAVSVPLADTVRFTFSAPLSPTAPPMVAFTPEDSITVGTPVFSGDGRTVKYPVAHRPQTYYVHLVLGAQSAAGEPLERPYALNYTTASSNGSFTVTGRVTGEGVSPDAAIVALLTLDPSGGIRLAKAAVLNGTSGNYSLGPVPVGAYSAGGLLLPYPPAARPFAYGFYDPNGDGTPDVIVIPFNVNVTLRQPAPVTARTLLDAATAEAGEQAPDQQLVMLPANPVDSTGRAPLWTYTFHSPSQAELTTVLATGLLTFSSVVAAPGGPPTAGPVPIPFADSDGVLATAEGAGGAAFRDEHAARTVLVTLRGGYLPDDFPPATAAYWRVSYTASEGGVPVDSFGVFVDMATGMLLGTTTTAGEPGTGPPDVFALGVPSPNPTAGPVHLPFVLETAGLVRLSVLDGRGREVAVVVEETLPSGARAARWVPGPGLASGVYFVRLSAGGRTAVRPFVLRR